jgi:peptidoglycan/LPS O-acetylase OafA/YrhL
LYYLVLLLSAAIWQYIPNWHTFVLCMTFFPNIAYYLGIPWVTSPPQWSIGVEEQFYLMWPFVIATFRKNLVKLLITFVIVYSLLPHALLYVLNHYSTASPELERFISRFFFGTKFNLLALGGIAAWVWHSGYRPRILQNKIVSNAVVIIPFAMWFSGVTMGRMSDEIFGVIFAVLIFHLATMARPPVLLQNKVSIYLGRISYGIYMYHYMVMMLCFEFLHGKFSGSLLGYNLSIYLMVYGFTLGVAALSFHTLEKYFLSLKEKFHTPSQPRSGVAP